MQFSMGNEVTCTDWFMCSGRKVIHRKRKIMNIIVQPLVPSLRLESKTIKRVTEGRITGNKPLGRPRTR